MNRPMDVLKQVERDLKLPRKRCKVLSPSRIIALVPQQWAFGESPRTCGPVLPDDLDERMCALCLAPSYTHIPEPWIKVSIKVIPKRPGLANSLPSGSRSAIKEDMGYAELMATISNLKLELEWAESYRRYGHTRERITPVEQVKKNYNDVLRDALTTLYSPSCIVHLNKGQFHQDAFTLPNCLNHNIQAAMAVLESDQAFYLLQPYSDHTLHDLLHFSPSAVFENSTAKSMFLLYQILRLMSDLHERGLSIGKLSPYHLLVDQNLWISVSVPCVNAIERFACLDQNVSQIKQSFVLNPGQDLSPRDLAPVASLGDLVHLWVDHHISNFQYLMCLNYLAGRRHDSPNHHPILPWIIDFTSPNSGFRDLEKSKYRLNKGDDQLDLTYETDPCIGSLHPHHISDFLSDITYYVYEARRIPKQVLCTHVRRKWVPHEYPTSMQRIYEWTPDECIPAFYNDPEIFRSKHDDLPDLELPEWCRTPEEFIEKHQALLESDRVSAHLHDWIDLTFGYKLSGKAAVAAKNVCLQLVNHHTRLTNHGVVQLFNHAHPSRAKPNNYWTGTVPKIDSKKKTSQDVCGKSEKDLESIHAALQVFGEAVGPLGFDSGLLQPEKMRPNLAGVRYTDEQIALPADFNAVEALNSLEKMYEFSSKNVHKLPSDDGMKLPPCRSAHDRLTNSDLNEFSCLMMEIVVASKLRLLDPAASLHQRYDMIRNVVKNEWKDVPRTVRRAATQLLRLNDTWLPETATFHNDNIAPGPDELYVYEDPCISSGYLLHKSTSPFPFPEYFRQFYSLVTEIKNLDYRIKVAQKSGFPAPLNSSSDDVVSDLYREKVLAVNEILIPILPDLDSEGVELILPYIVELFECPHTTVSSAWLLFNHIGRSLGPKDTAKHFLPALVKLYNGENASKKHLKLYERSFLRQIFIRLGLQMFLGHFSTLLVEAAAAYRDFPGEEEVFEDRKEPSPAAKKLSTATIESELQLAEDGPRHDRSSTKLESVMELEFDKPVKTMNGMESENELETMTDSILIHDYDTPGNSPEYRAPDDSDEDDVGTRKSDSSSKSREDDVSSCSDSDACGQGLLSVHSVSRLLERGDRAASSSSAEAEAEIEQSAEIIDTDELETQQNTLTRSETEEFTKAFLESYAYKDECNVCDVAAESIKWIARKLGPLLTAKFFSRNLLRMLTLCYVGEEQMQVDPVPCEEGSALPASKYRLVGDRNARHILQCLAYIATLYGEQVIFLQYIPHIKDVIEAAHQKFKNRSEAGLVGCLALIQHLLPYLTEGTFMENLQSVLFEELLLPIIRVASSKRLSFSGGGRTRQALFHKVIDILYLIGIRIGFEFTRQMMTPVLQRLFASFDRVYGRSKKNSSDSKDTPAREPVETSSDLIEDNVFCEIKKDLTTNEYKISTPVSVDQLGKAASWQYSLSPPFEDQRDNDDSDPGTNSTHENIMKELRETFTPELAHTAYVPFCKLAGGIYMDEKLTNHDLIRQLCSTHDEALSQRQVSPDTEHFSDEEIGDSFEADAPPPLPPKKNSGSPASTVKTNGRGKAATTVNGKPAKSSWFVNYSSSDKDEGTSELEVSGHFGKNVSMSGNRIIVDRTSPERPQTSSRPAAVDKRPQRTANRAARLDMSLVRNEEITKNKERHLKGNWLAYWEHELGLNEKNTPFNFKQIKLQTFTGHTNSVRAITTMDMENAFITASKDKTVKLWSIHNTGDGQTRQPCRWTYQGHRKSVFAVSFLESTRVALSCDSSLHIWDPFVGMGLRQMEAGGRTPAVCVLAPLPAPSTQAITATTEGTLRFLDVRMANYAHEFKCTYGAAGYIKSVSVSPNTNWVAVGYSSGVISILDVRTGFFLKAWKGHEGEILQIKAFDNQRFLTSSFDQTIALWNQDDGKVLNYLRGHTEAALCFSCYKNEVISATVANRVGVHSSVDSPQCEFTCTKLQSDAFKGVLTSMAVLPLNRQLLLGADNGTVRLLC